MKTKKKSLLPVILSGIKRNIIPGLILQLIALTLVVCYYFIPAAESFFNVLGDIKTSYGFIYSSLATALFGGTVPFFIMLIMGRIKPENRMTDFIFLTCFWGIKGIEIDLLYRLMGILFGTEPSLSVVVPKVFTDQFIYGPLWAGPTMTIAYLFKDNNFSLRTVRKELANESLLRRIAIVWCSSLVIWIPAVSIIYSLPQNLQLPLFNIILCFFALILALVAKGTEKSELEFHKTGTILP
ncbi:MAG: hypothetical protein JXK07_16055 [Spirochaetes bacterium]|nr:hypothetical protein [Spirochaetota bacterium]MBN2772005.1 hypothetical protein [Spirochaetota bacterium]